MLYAWSCASWQYHTNNIYVAAKQTDSEEEIIRFQFFCKKVIVFYCFLKKPSIIRNIFFAILDIPNWNFLQRKHFLKLKIRKKMQKGPFSRLFVIKMFLLCFFQSLKLKKNAVSNTKFIYRNLQKAPFTRPLVMKMVTLCTLWTLLCRILLV